MPSQCYIYGWQELSIYFVSWKTCQGTKFNHIQPVQSIMKKSSHMWLAKPAILQSDYKKKKSVCDDKNCQSTQCVHMGPALKSTYMWSVTKPFICGYPNQQWNKLLTRSFTEMTRAVNLPRNIVLKSVQWDQCAMTRTVGWDSSPGRAEDHHVTGPRFNTHSQLNLAGGWLSPPSLCWYVKWVPANIG